MAIQERRYTVSEFEAFIARAENENRLFELINEDAGTCGIIKSLLIQ